MSCRGDRFRRGNKGKNICSPGDVCKIVASSMLLFRPSGKSDWMLEIGIWSFNQQFPWHKNAVARPVESD